MLDPGTKGLIGSPISDTSKANPHWILGVTEIDKIPHRRNRNTVISLPQIKSCFGKSLFPPPLGVKLKIPLFVPGKRQYWFSKAGIASFHILVVISLNKRDYCLPGLKARSPRSSYWQGPTPSELAREGSFLAFNLWWLWVFLGLLWWLRW